MARNDLLIQLVRAGFQGDRATLRTVTEAIIDEERAKQHTVLADRLETILRVEKLKDLPAFGMWADREDMEDTIAWVRALRESREKR